MSILFIIYLNTDHFYTFYIHILYNSLSFLKLIRQNTNAARHQETTEQKVLCPENFPMAQTLKQKS